MVCIILSFNKIQPFIQREREPTKKKKKKEGKKQEKKSKRERDFQRYRCVRVAEK